KPHNTRARGSRQRHRGKKCDKVKKIMKGAFLMDLFLTLLIIFISIILIFYGVCHIIKLWTGCNNDEAVAKLHNFINGTVMYSFYNDMGFINNIYENIKNIIGEKRFEQLVRLSKTAISTPLIFFGENSGLPYIAISLFYADENEKQIIETVLINLITQYLRIYGYYELTLVNWKERFDLKMPVLEIRYARTREEQRILDIGLQNNRQTIISVNNDVIDDTDSDDLNE
ncbi:MAG: hypothetical protein NC452_08435, partial [Eubacterium sp.]|nr:hypothetical protein [Eubacterium sp.]